MRSKGANYSIVGVRPQIAIRKRRLREADAAHKERVVGMLGTLAHMSGHSAPAPTTADLLGALNRIAEQLDRIEQAIRMSNHRPGA